MTELSTLTPAEVDALWNEAFAARANAISRVAYIITARQEQGFGGTKKVLNSLSLAEIAERMENKLAELEAKEAPLHPNDRTALESLTKNFAAFNEATAQLAACNTEWEDRGGWTRYYAVNGGKIHAWGCGSWRWGTQVGLVTELSGKTADEAIAAHGSTVCTRCFKDAPLDVAPADDKCRPTYSEVDSDAVRAPRYAKCTRCGYVGAKTSTGLLRAHKAAS